MRSTEEEITATAGWLWMKKNIWYLDQLLQLGWVKHYIDTTTDSPKWRMYGQMDENEQSNVTSECNELPQNDYKKLRHD